MLAEDAVQETFFKVWQHLDSFRGDGSFEGWILRICRNTLFDLEARERRRTTTTLDAGGEPSSHPDQRGELWDLLGPLPRDQREALVLVGVFGYSYEDTAAILDVPVGTIRSRLHRARHALAGALDAVEHVA